MWPSPAPSAGWWSSATKPRWRRMRCGAPGCPSPGHRARCWAWRRARCCSRRLPAPPQPQRWREPGAATGPSRPLLGRRRATWTTLNGDDSEGRLPAGGGWSSSASAGWSCASRPCDLAIIMLLRQDGSDDVGPAEDDVAAPCFLSCLTVSSPSAASIKISSSSATTNCRQQRWWWAFLLSFPWSSSSLHRSPKSPPGRSQQRGPSAAGQGGRPPGSEPPAPAASLFGPPLLRPVPHGRRGHGGRLLRRLIDHG